MSPHEMERFVNLMNARLSGVPLIHFKSRLHNEVSSELGNYVSKYEELIRMMEGTLLSDEEDR